MRLLFWPLHALRFTFDCNMGRQYTCLRFACKEKKTISCSRSKRYVCGGRARKTFSFSWMNLFYPIHHRDLTTFAPPASSRSVSAGVNSRPHPHQRRLSISFGPNLVTPFPGHLLLPPANYLSYSINGQCIAGCFSYVQADCHRSCGLLHVRQTP